MIVKNKEKYNCPLTDHEVDVVKGYVTTGIGTRINQRGRSKENSCPYKDRPQCFRKLR